MGSQIVSSIVELANISHKTADVMRKLESWGLVEVSMPEVKHRGKAYGCVLRHSDGWKVV